MSTPIAFHVMHSLRDRRVIFPQPAQRADAYLRALRIGERFGLGWFHLGSDHIHVVLFCTRAEVSRWANAIESSWKQGARLGIGFAPYHAKPVADQGHLRTLVRYILDQERRHGVALDPDHLGSTGPDLCGGRLVGLSAARRVYERLPTLRPAKVEAILLGGERRLPLRQLGPAPAGLAGEPLEAELRSAAAATVGRASLGARSARRSDLHRALAELVTTTPLRSTVELGRLLGLRPSALSALRARPVDPRTLAAVRWQVTFRLTRRVVAQRNP